MDPENHSLVKFLRFLNFNDAAEQYVDFLLGGDTVNIHPDIVKAAELIDKRRDIFPANPLQRQPNENIIFRRVAEQFDLFTLPSGLIQPENNDLRI